ncbi:pyridoxal 5'-phosphate synthase glutaminase subunit PdxT [Cutibacterium granulosum]|uniref:pyridoxal 5'-phosphate synthase glutaminase subunit PdxT n=1 Tax=Cutibacterium granulosum TaxID=33011 RepID=UPI002B2397D2|nr:pyridoxal 5'-phosphate synthase glutaminase subunit PdxT [Cutibacterium granulosum]MEA5655780.1 pyridoxal 5'-phosphate synthase glutaminase subunit PdxT [Cutibacterium granulosum]
MVRVGILALQGGVDEHAAKLRQLDVQVRKVRRPADLDGLDGIVLPGGESTVFDKLARTFHLDQPLRDAIAGGLPTLATCAGLIYCAREVRDAAVGQQTLGVLDVVVGRNAFGSQVDSFETTLEVTGYGSVPATFIRAPRVVELGPAAQAIATMSDGSVVGVQQGRITALAFHPEQNKDLTIHRTWVDRL